MKRPLEPGKDGRPYLQCGPVSDVVPNAWSNGPNEQLVALRDRTSKPPPPREEVPQSVVADLESSVLDDGSVDLASLPPRPEPGVPLGELVAQRPDEHESEPPLSEYE